MREFPQPVAVDVLGLSGVGRGPVAQKQHLQVQQAGQAQGQPEIGWLFLYNLPRYQLSQVILFDITFIPQFTSCRRS